VGTQPFEQPRTEDQHVDDDLHQRTEQDEPMTTVRVVDRTLLDFQWNLGKVGLRR
jgi:hypothetical protein